MKRIALLATTLLVVGPVAAFAGPPAVECDLGDLDGICDSFDNCSTKDNPAQDDTDGDDCGNLCDADYNQDGRVTITDFGAFAICFGMTGCAGKQHVEPISNANIVNLADFGYFAFAFGGIPGPSGTTPGTVACP